jgi:hypothetical protein
MSTNTERYYDLGDDTIKKIEELSSKFTYSPIRIDYLFIGDNKLKKLIKISKIADDFQHAIKKQVKITINESLWDLLSHEEDIIELLVREEFNSLSINTETGKIKIEKHSFNTSNSIIEKYSFEAVKRAKDLEALTLSQTEEKEKEVIDISA